MTTLGLGARVMLGSAGEEAAGRGGNLAAPLLAQALGGGEGTVGGDLLLAIIAGGRVRDDPRGRRRARHLGLRRGRPRRVVEHRPRRPRLRARGVCVARIAALAIGAIAIAIAIIGGAGLNVSFMVGLAFAVAASANFPALLLALTWRRFNTTGAVVGVLVGVIARWRSWIVSPAVWPGPDSERLAVAAREPGDHLDPARLHRLLAGDVLSREGPRADLPRAVRPLGDRHRGRARSDALTRSGRIPAPQGVRTRTSAAAPGSRPDR